jgi:hypothetical protein
MKRIVLTFGLIAGAVLSAMMLITMPLIDRIEIGRAEVIGYTTMVAAFLMVYFGIRTYRDNVLAGSIGFGRAFQAGLYITLVASACYVATWQLIYYKVAPDFGEKYAAHMVEKARASGATPAEIEVEVRNAARFPEMYKNPLINVAITFVEPLPVALLITLVSAGVLSRRAKISTQVAP